MKVLLVAVAFPPATGEAVERIVGFSTLLPTLGIETHVLAPAEPGATAGSVPTRAWVHRAHAVAGEARSEERTPARRGVLERVSTAARLATRRLLPGDASWNVTAIPAAVRIVRAEGIDVVVTASPPSSVHLVGATARRATGVGWVADVQADLGSGNGVAQADAIACASDELTGSTRRLAPDKRIVTVQNGAAEALAELVGSVAS